MSNLNDLCSLNLLCEHWIEIMTSIQPRLLDARHPCLDSDIMMSIKWPWSYPEHCLKCGSGAQKSIWIEGIDLGELCAWGCQWKLWKRIYHYQKRKWCVREEPIMTWSTLYIGRGEENFMEKKKSQMKRRKEFDWLKGLTCIMLQATLSYPMARSARLQSPRFLTIFLFLVIYFTSW